MLQIFQLNQLLLHFVDFCSLSSRYLSNAVAKVTTFFKPANNFEKIFKIILFMIL